MAKKAVLCFKPIDYAYQREYGKMPDYDYTDRLKAGQPLEEVGALIESRMAKLWEKMKEQHERELAGEQDALERECPFK